MLEINGVQKQMDGRGSTLVNCAVVGKRAMQNGSQ